MSFMDKLGQFANSAKKAGEKGIKIAMAQKDILSLKGEIKELKIKIGEEIIETNEVNENIKNYIADVKGKEAKIAEIEESLKAEEVPEEKPVTEEEKPTE